MSGASGLLLFVATGILAIVTLVLVRRLRKQLPVQEVHRKSSPFLSLLHIPAYLFVFAPTVIGSIVAFPVLAVLLALLALATMLHARYWSPASSKRDVLVLAIVSTTTWLGYALYEYEMLQWSRTVVAPIRVDLLLLAPLLYATVISLFRFWYARVDI